MSTSSPTFIRKKISHPTSGNEYDVIIALNEDRQKEIKEAEEKGRKEGIEQGKMKMLEEAQEIVANEFEKNRKLAAELTSRIEAKLESVDMKFAAAHLKVHDPSALEVLILVREKDILSDKMLEIYSFVDELEEENEDVVEFNFVNKSTHFNQELLISDGFTYRYGKKKG